MQIVNTTWDLRVVAADNAASVVSYVPRWTSIEFSDQLNDVGSGRVVHDFNDPFFANFEADNGYSLLTGPYALQIVRNNISVFTFFIEDVQVDRVDEVQQLIVSGRGIGSALEWAIVLPEGFSGQTRVGSTTNSRPRFFDRLFPGYEYLTRCATTENLGASYSAGPSSDLPGVAARLTASSNGSINTSGIDGITDFVIGDTVLVKNQSNSAHNGVYWIADLGSASTVWIMQRVSICDGSPVTDLAAGRTAFAIEGATNGHTAWELAVSSTVTSPTQVGTVGITFSSMTSGSYTGIGAFYILFKEADTGYEYASAKGSDWGTQVTTSGRGGSEFSVDWPLSIDTALNSSEGLLDSKGEIVQDGGSFSIPVGKTMLEVLKQASEQTQTDWHVDAGGVISIAIRPFSRNGVVKSEPLGTDRTTGAAAKLFTLPMMTKAETKTSSSARRTIVFGSDGRQLDRLISPSTTIYGRRESYFENTSDDAPAVANLTASAIRKVDGGKLQVTASFAEREDFIAWDDFSVGDKVLIEIEIGVFTERIIAAISSQVSASGEKSVEITFGEVFSDIATDLASAAGFGSLNASELATFSGKPSNVFLHPPTSTSIIPTVAGLSNRATVNWDSSSAGRVSQYELNVLREAQQLSGSVYVSVVYQATDLVREGNICTATFDAPHGFSEGDSINVYTVDGFSGFNIPIFAVSSSVQIKYENQGPDDSVVSVNPYVADITKVVESISTIVDGSKSSAAVENLSAPGREYLAVITPFNEFGIAGDSSGVTSFIASSAPLTLLDSDIQSSNYLSASVGWRISADGSAEFNGGSFSVTSIDIGGFDSTSFHVDTAGNMWAGASASVSAPFRVSNAGVMTATTGTFSGAVSGGTIDIGGSDSTSFHVDTSGNMWIGASSYASAPFKISADGYVSSTNGATFYGQLASSSDARFSADNNYISYIQNDGRFESIVSSTVYARVSTSGIFVKDGTPLGSLNGTNGVVTLRGQGISYADVSYGPGYHNAMALEWDGSNAFVVIDGAALEYLNDSVSDRRIKRNIAEPEEYWVNKILNDVKIWQFNKINPFNEDDMHMYPLRLGVIADEFKEIFPQFESSSLLADPDGADAEKIRSVQYAALISPMLLTIQKLNERIKVLEARLGI